jgi:hypothetical protein
LRWGTYRLGGGALEQFALDLWRPPAVAVPR